MFIDTHCHLTSEGLIERVDDVITRAHAAGVERLITVAQDLHDAQAALELMHGRPNLYLVAGIHPHRAGQCTSADMVLLAGLVAGGDLDADVTRRIVALGETGLDFHYDFAPPARQEKVLLEHLETAVRLGRPVVIHARLAERRVCEILRGFPQLAGRVVFHCFSGDPELARDVLDVGGYLSFTGVVTFKNAAPIRAAALYVPMDRIMLETDAPYLSPEPVRKTRPNEPALMVHTARYVAELRNMELSALAAATTANAVRFFNLTEDGS